MAKLRFICFGRSLQTHITMLSVFLMLVAVAAFAQKDEATAEGIWNFDNGDGADTSGKGLDGTLVGDPEVVDGIVGKALHFDGDDDGVKLPDSVGINTIAQPEYYSNRTIALYFNCDDVSITSHKQTIFEEGGRTRGLVINVFDGHLYVAGWNRAEYNWDGAWPSAPVESNRWYHVGLVIRDAVDAVEPDKFEMWLDGERIASEEGAHSMATATISVSHMSMPMQSSTMKMAKALIFTISVVSLMKSWCMAPPLTKRILLPTPGLRQVWSHKINLPRHGQILKRDGHYNRTCFYSRLYCRARASCLSPTLL